VSDVNSATWSETAASNNAAVPNGWPTSGMLPSEVDNTAREMMGAIKREWNRSHPTVTTGGTTTAITLTPTTAVTAYSTGLIFAAKLANDIGANATLNVSGLGAKKIYTPTRTTLAQPSGGEAKAGHVLFFSYDASLDSANGGFVVFAGLPQQPFTEAIMLSVTGETTVVATGSSKVTFRMPYAFTVSEVRASLNTAQFSGASLVTVNIKENGTTILSTKITIDNGEKTSVTAATPPVISDTSLASDSLITIDVDAIGDGTAKGLKVCIIGRQT
jgi:hypothetical protein